MSLDRYSVVRGEAGVCVDVVLVVEAFGECGAAADVMQPCPD